MRREPEGDKRLRGKVKALYNGMHYDTPLPLLWLEKPALRSYCASPLKECCGACMHIHINISTCVPDSVISFVPTCLPDHIISFLSAWSYHLLPDHIISSCCSCDCAGNCCSCCSCCCCFLSVVINVLAVAVLTVAVFSLLMFLLVVTPLIAAC